MRIFALLAGLAVLGALLLADNWNPIRAVLYAVAWLAVAAILIKFARVDQDHGRTATQHRKSP
ncbi:hypothetical protein [Nocardia salmonicida]|uniref:hypothetical protein n=1 Tax=Nocardia salmonicida TaxID=53431 RepID=UPI0033DED875